MIAIICCIGNVNVGISFISHKNIGFLGFAINGVGCCLWDGGFYVQK